MDGMTITAEPAPTFDKVTIVIHAGGQSHYGWVDPDAAEALAAKIIEAARAVRQRRRQAER